jgi:integrase
MKNNLDTKVEHETKNMKSQTHLTKSKDGVYYYRRRIPSHLLQYFKSKVIKKSLKTKDVREAKRTALNYDIQTLNEFEALERKHNLVIKATPPVDIVKPTIKLQSLGSEEIKLLTNSYIRDNLEIDEIFRDKLKKDSRDLSQDDIQNSQSEEINNAIAFYENIEMFYEFAGALARNYGVDFNALDPESKNKLTKSFLVANKDSAKIQEKRDKGDWVETSSVVSEEDTLTGKLFLDDLLKTWQFAEPDRDKKTVAKYKYILDDFKKHVDNKNVKLISSTDAVNYRESLNAKKNKAKTVKDKLKVLKAIFERSKRNRIIRDNPFDIDLTSTTTQYDIPRIPYVVEDLEIIFNSPLYQDNFRPKGGAGEASVWVIALAYATGARLEEICQLRTNNIKTLNSIPFLQITSLDQEGNVVGKIKNKSSIRSVPLHNDLIEAGFLRYVAGIKTEFLFNQLKADTFGRRGGNWSKWYGRYVRQTLGIISPKKTFHSFRHTFIDLCRNNNVSAEVRNALTGHAEEGMARKYGDGHYLQKLNEEIQQIKFPVPIPLIIK